jgi:hypothetical protein
MWTKCSTCSVYLEAGRGEERGGGGREGGGRSFRAKDALGIGDRGALLEIKKRGSKMGGGGGGGLNTAGQTRRGKLLAVFTFGGLSTLAFFFCAPSHA